MICHYYDAPTYLFFASDLPELLYYSHIPATIIALLVGFFVFLNSRKQLLNILLLLIAVCFSLWTFINLIAWTNIQTDVILFSWTFFGVLQSLISILCIYFIHVFLTKTDLSFIKKMILFLLVLPVLLLAATNINIAGFDLDWCDAFDYEGVAFLTYYSLLGVVAMVWIATLLFTHYKEANQTFRKQIIFMGIGIELFLFSFFGMTYIGSMAAISDFYTDSQLEFYGLFGMTIFMIFIGILIVRFKTFSVGAVAAQALTVALLLLVGSQLTFSTSPTSTALTILTLLFTSFVGVMLIRNVKHEIKQRQELESLTKKLEKANKRLKILDQMKSEFVSIASHQLRSPLTSIRGYASMLLEGSYGKLSTKAKEAVERIADSSHFMAESVEDYLNVSRIQAGNMKYEYSDFNIKTEAEHIADDIRRQALKGGLMLRFKSDMDKQGIVHADIGKTRQILHNLINNALKYTPKGSITVFVHDKKKEVFVDIIDTGIGMSKETQESIFDKFERAHNANEVNVTGTGLGLFIARKIAREMNGEVTASSEGEGKGSVFTLKLPLLM